MPTALLVSEPALWVKHGLLPCLSGPGLFCVGSHSGSTLAGGSRNAWHASWLLLVQRGSSWATTLATPWLTGVIPRQSINDPSQRAAQFGVCHMLQSVLLQQFPALATRGCLTWAVLCPN